MGPNDPVPVAQTMERRDVFAPGTKRFLANARRCDLIVVLFACLVFLLSSVSPPSLMDDVDAVQAQIARNMITSGDWVTAHLDGIPYLEKSPLVYWLIAISFKAFGFHDFAARLPIALSAVLLCCLTAWFTRWALGTKAGLYAGLVLATSIGLFLFTRILIPDVILTLTITLALFGFMRTLEPDERHKAWWAYTFWAAMGTGLLLKGLIAAVFPMAAAFLYLLFTRQLLLRATWLAAAPCSPACCSSSPSRRPGTCLPLCAIRPTWSSQCTANRALITAFSGSISSTSTSCAF